ncbi:C40 family peptidase [Desulfosporosinus sp. FKB]|uniref:C40 family peptidase n=1 Tax=Desulfosporosinus sp. FKB TaxID=1969835 RepID=UPI000B4997D7|nr:C40 family peptidase [Desulfosporosinus sp. FKB]
MKLSPALSQLSGVILSGMLLVGNVLVPSTSQTLGFNSFMNSSASTSSSTSVIVPQFIHQQLSSQKTDPIFTTIPTVMAAIPKENQVQTKTTQTAEISPPESTSSVHMIQVAQAASNNTMNDEANVSRGSSNHSDIIDHAVSLVGKPYVFGGTSLKGFDCSGFTQYVFAGSGITLPRTSYAQYASGGSVSKSNLQPGDLVFFSTYSKGASHVGIYIGGGKFVHADNPKKGVTITSLSDSFYVKNYLGARRYK